MERIDINILLDTIFPLLRLQWDRAAEGRGRLSTISCVQHMGNGTEFSLVPGICPKWWWDGFLGFLLIAADILKRQEVELISLSSFIFLPPFLYKQCSS